MLRRVGLIAGALALLALLFLITGHWVVGLVCAAAAVAAIWLFLQLRTVR
jgi:hypothetical protein